ncbi:hypothetical protein QQZ08_007403 [Neonectria magnoliae]|uniref:Uncharacterized protein n=1 Tax=Neonectria magnoliae TaxID=2732573 RepID=A0ABR1HZL1_9HYPO
MSAYGYEHPAQFGAVRPTPAPPTGQYLQAAQNEHEHELQFQNHQPQLQQQHVGSTFRNPMLGNGGHRYDLLVETQDIATDPPHPVSPLRPSDEYDRNVPLPVASPAQAPWDPSWGPKEASSSVGPPHDTSYPAPPPGWPDGAKKHMWTPIWLTKTVLVVFSMGFAAMMLATGLLYHFSVENHGIIVQKESNHYGWKYGPTALLVVVGALWRQVDHHNKILMPWKELQQGPAPVHKTLLLDYISPILSTSLWTAMKNRHWAVVMSTVGHLLILGTTIFSTGLLILESTEVTKESNDFSVKGKFEIVDPDITQPANVGPAAAQLYYGIHFQGLDYPAGTSEDTLLPVFQVPESATDNLNYTVETEGMKLDLDCEILPITNGTQTSMPWYSILGSFFVANVSTPDCNITGIMLAGGPDHGYYHQKNATQNYQGLFDVYPCNVDFDFANQYVESANTKEYDIVYNTTADQRVVLAIADLRFDKYNASRISPATLYIHEVKVALCKPSYNLQNFEVRSSTVINGSSQAVLSTAAAPDQKEMNGLSGGFIALSVSRSSNMFYLGTGGQDYVLSQQVPTFFQLMSMKNGNISIGAFLDPELLVETGKNVFKGIATQVLRQLALKPVDEKVAGQVTYTEDRLHVKVLSTGFMLTFLALLTLLALGMIFVRPHSVIPREPGSIAATATMLAASPALQETLMYMGASRRSQIRKRLQAFSFRSIIVSGPQPTLMVEPIPQNKEATLQLPNSTEQAITWWRPMSGELWFLALAIGLPLLLIVALEVVQHFSDKNSGFLNIGPNDAIVFATYIPAAIVLGVASMYSALELMAAVFAPFDILRRGKATANRSVHTNLVGKLLPHAAFLSLKTRHFAVLIALLGNFVGGFLTIVVSGLYSVNDIPRIQNLIIQQTDTFNLDNVNLSLEDNQAAAIDSLIEYLDLAYPQWTYKGLAFNHFKAPEGKAKNTSAEAPLEIEVPATRAKLNCTSIPNDSRQITIIRDDQSGSSIESLPGSSNFVSPTRGYVLIGVNTTLEFSEWCETSPAKNASAAFWMQYFWLPYDYSPAYIGKASVMLWDSQGILADGALDTDPTSGTGLGANGMDTGGFGCPTFSVTLGTARATDSETHGNLTEWSFEYDLSTLLCYQNVEEVTTNLTWSLPGFVLADTKSPKTDESTAKLLKTPDGSERHEYAVNAWLLGLRDSVFNRTIPGPNNSSSYNNYVDNFVRGLVYGKSGRPLEDLIGDGNIANLTKASDDLYQAYMAQAISLNMRSNSTKGGSLPTYNGTLSTPGYRRLRQNRAPKIALQAMLAVMVASAIGLTLLIRVREVLPHNPCSIAGTATLVAGSEMASSRIVPPCAEWRSDKELKQLGIFEQYVYALTWWVEYGGDRSSRQRYGIDVDRRIG